MEASRKKQKPNEISIKHGKSGGHIVRHSFDNSMSGPSYMPSEEHVVANDADLFKHLTKHYFTAPTAANDDGATAGAGANPKVAKNPDVGASKPAGVAGKAKAKAPNQQTTGAGLD